MLIETIQFKGHRCFKKNWAGFSELRKLNIIIGRNNSGKSHLLDLVARMCERQLHQENWQLYCSGVLDENTLKTVFAHNSHGGGLPGDHWIDHGKHLRATHVSWIITSENTIGEVTFKDPFAIKIGLPENSQTPGFVNARIEILRRGLIKATTPISGKLFRRLSSERDIQPEAASIQLALTSGGRGATNIIRRYITTADPEFPRDVIQKDLLHALNEVFGCDGQFTEVIVRHHDDKPPYGIANDTWEIFLGQEKKGPIALSRCGSGLKTVILVLLHLLVLHKIEKKAAGDYVFAFEELENSLHPALLRRLFQFIEVYALKENISIFFTTHSSTALDFFGVSSHAQLIHVTHDGESAKVTTVSAHFDKLGVISELGAKPSDLLQANGIIWVEGPSDCIYLNRWIDLFSEGKIKEGRDYQCAFYGGSLLARTQFTTPEEAERELVNLFNVNPNVVVICDSDKTSPSTRIKDRVRRISAEVKNIPNAHIWTTMPKEIENYLPGAVVAKALLALYPPSSPDKVTISPILKDPERYESFFPSKTAVKESYWEEVAKKKSYDKTELAVTAVKHMTRENMAPRFDLQAQMETIIEKIRSWNGE